MYTYVEIKNSLMKNKWVKKKIKKEVKLFWDKQKWVYNTYKLMRHSRGSKRDAYSNVCVVRKRKIAIKKP
jgi:hypothetical protein